MASPFWAYPGVWEGRLGPAGSSALGYDYGYGYTPTYGYVPTYNGYYFSYGGAYGYFSENVFCLGKDRTDNAPYHRIRLGDTIAVEQSFTITSAIKLLLFSWHFQVPADLPVSRDVVSGGVVSFVSGDISGGGRGVASSDSGESGLIIVDKGSGSGSFSRSDAELPVTISGSSLAVNNGLHRISAVPEDQGEASGGDRAVIENSGNLTGEMAQVLDDAGVTVRVHGVRWRGHLIADWGAGWQERFDLVEYAEHNYIRDSLALHVSQYVGPLSMRFELQAEMVG